jgi:Rrf2 family protein
MRLSTRSRYGTRLMVDLAQHYDEGPVAINDIAKRQDISPKYLEQLIIPLKKMNHIKSVRGPKGGHMLARPPEKITVGEIVKTLEGETSLVYCIENPESCNRVAFCSTRDVWKTATEAMFNTLDAVTLLELVETNEIL